MKFFHLVHLAPEGGKPASNLWFLDRNTARNYQKTLVWPWQSLGFFRLPSTLEEIPLPLLKLKIESTILPASFDPDLEWICWRREDKFGYSPMVPGRCFDPHDWRNITDSEMRDPMLAPKIAQAERDLDEILKNKDPEAEAPGSDSISGKM